MYGDIQIYCFIEVNMMICLRNFHNVLVWTVKNIQ